LEELRGKEGEWSHTGKVAEVKGEGR